MTVVFEGFVNALKPDVLVRRTEKGNEKFESPECYGGLADLYELFFLVVMRILISPISPYLSLHSPP
jgi:hypothetical protein